MKGMDDSRLELIMGRVLQAGVLIAALAMVAGGFQYLRQHGAEITDYRVFHPVALMGGDWLFLWVGVFAMLATPILRVIFAVFAFAAERDWLYTGVSLLVLGLLCFAIWV